MKAAPWRATLRGHLLVGILVPVLGFVVLNAASLYRQALQAADTAYDRTLLASAKALGELLEVSTADGTPRLQSNLLYSALEAFEADNRSRLYYKVSGFAGEMVSGFADLPPAEPVGNRRVPYAALVHFYDASYRDEPVRMAVLLQPVSGPGGQGMATIQVAETLELRKTLARELLLQTLWQQALLVAVIAGVVVWVVQRATRPVRELSQRLQERSATDLSPLPSDGAPRELRPIVDATNAVLARMGSLLEHQKRFVRDASHQLRTPLAVLTTQVQSARRGDVAPALALDEIATTVEGATELANQMLALAKVEQLRQQGVGEGRPVEDWAPIVRAVALDLSALIAHAELDFDITTTPAPVRAHAWGLRELTRNLLHNAIRHTPPRGRLGVTLAAGDGLAVLTVADSGPGIAPEQRERLFQAFATSRPDANGHSGTGLGLAICHEIVLALGGRIELNNRVVDGRVDGLDSVVSLKQEMG
jgi:two-component system sensor histidine kinase TctE